MMETDKKIKQKAFNWSVDYKPFDEDLNPKDYARHGYEEGYKRAMSEIEGIKAKTYTNGYDSGYSQATQDSRGFSFIEKNPMTVILLSTFIVVIVFLVALFS